MARPSSFLRGTPPPIQRAQAHVASLPAPVGGWNARDAWANMAPTDAVRMVNMFPGGASCDLRGGSTRWATGMSGQIESLMVYAGAAANKMFAIDAGSRSIFDVSNSGPVGAAVVSGLTNARFEYTNVSTPGGNYLYAVNGFDNPLLYDGINWSHISATSTPIAITGGPAAGPTALTHVYLFKNRVWFIEANSLRAWYLPTQSIGGQLQMLDLSSVAMLGGTLVDMLAWTVDAGYGMNDNLVFYTSKGEIVVYQGTDPASLATWAEIGVWQIGAPVGNRNLLIKFGGDGLILSLDGIIPLAQGLQSSRIDTRVAISFKIQAAINTVIRQYRQNFGWQIFYYPKQAALIVNIPMGVGVQQQFVMNTITGSWCNFQGWPANVFALFNDEPYFGGNGIIYHAWDIGSYADDGANIDTDVVQAFNYFEMRGVEKYFTRARPNILTNGNPSIRIGLAIDFSINEYDQPISFSPTGFGYWDSGLWDAALWGQNMNLSNDWQGVAGVGYCAGIDFESASQGIQISWASTDIVFQAGWAGI